MEPGPLPPHERSWRHPSELGPTSADVDHGGNSSRTVATAFATGTLAVLLIGVLVVAVTPSAPAGPITLSATTSPGVTASEIATSTGGDTTGTASVGATQTTPRQAIGAARQPIGLVSFSAMPNAVAAAPPLTLDGRHVAEQVPDDADPVHLHTEAVTYHLDWHVVVELTTFAAVPDGSVVFDQAGDVVAHVRLGELVTIAGQ